MAVHLGTHPSADVLKAFGLGKLDDTATGTVMDHLDLCADCRKEVASQSGDDFLDRLRQAHGRSSTPAPAKALSPSVVGPKPSASHPAIPNLPPELANNPHYEILRELGRGGMGVVYLAKNKLMDRLEVLKVVNKALLDRPGSVERFLREIRSAAKLSHANVVAAYSALQMGELLAFAMEYVEGEDLAAVVKKQGPLPVAHACFYVQQAALGLQHAFEKKMVHRDIKPQNLILAREGKKHIVKVLDFGLAKVMREKTDDTGLTGEGKMLGTPDYIAPEQTLDAASADIRADIYSLGCTLYYLLSGHPPFSANSLGAILMAHQMQESKLLNLVRAEVPEELASVVRKMMAKSVAKRYQTPLEVVQALSPFVKQGASPKSSPDLSVGTAKAAVVKAVKIESPAAPVPEAPPAAWDSLTEGSITSAQPRKSGAVRKRKSPVVNTDSRKKWLMGGGIGVGVLLLALLGMWASGVFKVKTKDGILIVEVNEPNPDVYVDGEKVTVTWDNGGKKAEIRVKPGTRKVEVKKDGFVVDGKELAFKDGDKEIFTARLLPEKRVVKADVPPPDNVPPKSETPKPETPKPETPKPEPKKPDVAIAPVDPGFVPLFNGKDLAGWYAERGDSGKWTVEGGAIVGRSRGFLTRSYLLTDKDYANFTMRLEFMIDAKNNGAITFRAIDGESRDGQYFGHPSIEITDTAAYPYGATSCVKDDRKLTAPYNQLQLPTGVWHAMEITVLGDSCTAVVAGSKVVDLRLDPTSRGNFVPALKRRTGKIGLHAHTGTIRFRKIEIKELPAPKSDPAPPTDPARVPLFNGKDFTGWHGMPNFDPYKLAAMSEAERKAKIEEWTEDAKKHWKIDNGELVNDGQGAYLTTDEEYDDIELFLDYKIGPGADSGIYLRGTPQVQIWDWTDKTKWADGADKGSGGLWNNTKGAPGRDPLVRADRPCGEWNHMRILQIGARTTVWLNDKLVVDNAVMENFWDRKKPLLAKGPIQLQTNKGEVRLRNLFVRPIPLAEVNGWLEKHNSAGFVPLFNGRDKTGWKVHPRQRGNWRVENGVLIGSGPAVSHLYSSRGNYKNFHLRVEARINDGGNSGVCFRTPFGPVIPPNNPMFLGAYEAQINSTHADQNKTGSLYGVIPVVSIRESPVPPGQWFTMEVIAEGNRLVIKVDGKTTVDYRDDKRLHTSGHIALQQHNAATVAEFRKIEIKELTTMPAKK